MVRVCMENLMLMLKNSSSFQRLVSPGSNCTDTDSWGHHSHDWVVWKHNTDTNRMMFVDTVTKCTKKLNLNQESCKTADMGVCDCTTVVPNRTWNSSNNHLSSLAFTAQLTSVDCGELTSVRVLVRLVIILIMPMPNRMVTLPNIGGALCSTPQSLADAHY